MGYLDETGLSRVWNRIKAYIQSLNYTSNIGTVTGITMNNTSYSPVDGDVDIGTVVTDVSDKADDTDVVHKAGTENITGEKTFVGNKTVKFKQSSNSDKIGFTGYNTSNVECGNFEILPNDRAVNLGIYAPDTKPASDWVVGFKYQAKDSAGTVHKFGLRVPSRFGNSTYSEHYIPVVINNKEADNTGVITLSASDVGALSSSTVIPAAQIQSDWNQTTDTALDYIKNKPTIPTESTVSNWGFTKNTGTYIKPSTGIPASDIASGVIPTVPTNLSSFTDDLGSSPTHTHSQYLTSETEPDFNGSAAATITSSDISNWNGKTSNVGTITGITMNGTSKGTSGVVDLGTVITAHQSLTDYVQKSQTSGLLKNDGTVDQNTYLTIEIEPAYTLSAAATLTSNNIVKGTSQSYLIWTGTLSDYLNIVTKDANTLYFIKDPLL